MVDQSLGTSRTPAAAEPGRSAYAATRAVEIRARSTRYDQNAQMRTTLDRLDQRLASGEPLRHDVPPGFYLNILV
jgi:hypothetical protein